MFILVVTLPLTCWTSEGETFIPFSRSCLSFPFCKTRILNHGSVGPLLSSGMPFSSYGAKMKTSVNSRIKHGGKNPPSQSLSCGWWGYRCGVIYAAASLRRLASTPWEPGQLSALSLNGLSVPLLIVTLHPQWSAKAFFLTRWKEMVMELAPLWATDILPNLFSLRSQMIHSGNVWVPSAEEIRKIISPDFPQFPPFSWCLHLGSSQKVYYPTPQIFFQEWRI